MAETRIRLTPANLDRLRALLDEARTLEHVASRIEGEAAEILGGGDEMGWVLEYTANNPDLPFGAWCERAGVGYKRNGRKPLVALPNSSNTNQEK